jgi:signal transduction histidine kinase
MMNGFELLQALRDDPQARALPVVLLSARAGEEARIEGMRAGADDYLVKPFSARELLARVGAHLQMARMRRAASELERSLRKEAERARAQLEQQAKELEEAREKAEDANKVKAAFLATMSHELRTPLNAIIGYTDLLDAEIAGGLTVGQRGQLRRIYLASRHLLQMIEEILTFSRIEAGREEIHLDSVDLAQLSAETCKLVEPLATQKSLAFGYEGPERLMATTDAGRLRQILLNLLSNAIKFTERGEVRLTLTADGCDAVFEVRDSGIGISTEQLARIFEPFHQVDTLAARRGGGTGLGLSVSRELARLLGGDVSVTSALQRGSTFTVRIPIGRVNA